MEREIPKREDGWICAFAFAKESGKRLSRSRGILAELYRTGKAERRSIIVGKTTKNYYRLTPTKKSKV